MSKADPLAEIPCPPQWPFLGNTLQAIADFGGLTERATAAFGDVYRLNVMGRWQVAFTTAEAADYILGDPDGIFIDQGQRNGVLADFMPNADAQAAKGLFLDSALSQTTLDATLGTLNILIERVISQWPLGRRFPAKDRVNHLVGSLCLEGILGLEADDPLFGEIENALQALIEGMGDTVLPLPFPFARHRQNLRARKHLMACLAELIRSPEAAKRAPVLAAMQDTMTNQCDALQSQDAAQQLAQILIATNLLLRSSLATMLKTLCDHPEWQDLMAEEAASLSEGRHDQNQPHLCDLIRREALRLVPPVTHLVRVPQKDFFWEGRRIPAGNTVSVQITMIMRSRQHYGAPETFDPMRFNVPDPQSTHNGCANLPYGAGIYAKVGAQLVDPLVKNCCSAVLQRFQLSRPNQRPVSFTRFPVAQPRCGLHMVLQNRQQICAA